ncbi:MAG: NAD(P)H-dependent oxidoreductase [Arenimonas sp.]|nr:NAD(P)H-dependent oxidoreductase [Arenimonas sp.]
MTDTAPIRILAMAGSARSGALSVRLREAAAKALATAGATVEPLDLRALDLPLYDGDFEASQGIPEGARRLRDALVQSDGVLLVTPEYNGFPTPLELNAWDWLSRVPAEGDQPSGLAATAGKPLALLSSSPGALGGMRALGLVRQFLGGTFQMLVLPQQLALGKAHEAFDDSGLLKDARQQASLAQVAEGLVRLTRAG